MNFLKNNRTLVFILLGVFVVSLAYSFYFRARVEVDARAYDRIAWNLAQGYGYRELLDGPLEEDNAIMRVGPGYEIFLAVLYFIFGHSYEVVWVVHALLRTLSVLLIFLLAQNIFKEKFIGLVAALLVGFSPDLITINGLLMAETLGVLLITLTVYFFFLCFRNPTNFWFIVALGLSLGGAVMVRTPALFLIFPILFYLGKEKKYKYGFVLLVTIGFLFTPWIVRNYFVYHTFVPTNLAYGVDLASGNHLGATGELEPYVTNDRYLQQYGLVKGSQMLTREALYFIVTNPLEFFKLTIYRISIYFSFVRPTGFWFHLQGMDRIVTLILSVLYSVFLFTLGFFGATKIKYAPPEDRTKMYQLFSMLLVMPLAIAGVIVETRYRFLVYPFFALFAGYGINELRKKEKCLLCFAGIFFILFANTAFDIIRNLDRIMERISVLF